MAGWPLQRPGSRPGRRVTVAALEAPVRPSVSARSATPRGHHVTSDVLMVLAGGVAWQFYRNETVLCRLRLQGTYRVRSKDLVDRR